MKNSKLLHIHQKKLLKKIKFLKERSDTKFSGWKVKKKAVEVIVDLLKRKVSSKKFKRN